LGLEQAGRKLPDNAALSQLRTAIEAEGLLLLDADGTAGEGVRWARDNRKLWLDCLRYARSMLGFSLDDLLKSPGWGAT
jgi:hypothetical protein